jgi:hypothetical protein
MDQSAAAIAGTAPAPGRAINPYLGFLTGWLMVTGTLIGTLSRVVVLRPSVRAVFGATSASNWPTLEENR